MRDQTDDRIGALERLALAQAEALTLAIEHIRALEASTRALFAGMDERERVDVREAALAVLGDGPEAWRMIALVEALTAEPIAAQVEQQAAGADAPARLN